MSRTYKVTGINLKSSPLGEADRLLTILTKERGLVKAVAQGARKHHSSLAGRSELFVVNQLLVSEGRSLDKITQAETLYSYAGLSQHLAKLTAAQYLAELTLCQAMSDHPQEELFHLLTFHLHRLEATVPLGAAASSYELEMLALLSQAIYHLLALAGIAPQCDRCCVTQRPLQPNFSAPNWCVGFSPASGGVVNLAEVAAGTVNVRSTLTAGELALLQRLASASLTEVLRPEAQEHPERQLWLETTPLAATAFEPIVWIRIERLLRQYAQYHFERPIRSASLMDTCLATWA